MTDITITYNTFKNKFNALKALEPSQKLCVDPNTLKLYVDSTPLPFGLTIIQSTIRRLTNQTRDNLNTYLMQEFNDYKIFMNMVKDVYHQHDISGNVDNNTDYDNILETMKDMVSFNLDITIGLTNINDLYPGHPIQRTIDNIFKIILEYNAQFRTCLNIK